MVPLSYHWYQQRARRYDFPKVVLYLAYGNGGRRVSSRVQGIGEQPESAWDSERRPKALGPLAVGEPRTSKIISDGYIQGAAR